MIKDTDFGKYYIEKELGKGGMATIYLAVHKDLGRKVALKVMHRHLIMDDGAVSRFEMEAKAIAKLEHINILQVYDFGKYNDDNFIAMELVDGVDAEKFLKDNGTFPPDITAIIFCAIANGLNQAHIHKIIHRDIKLSNIILKKDGLAKLADFGIVKLEDQAGLTQTDSVVGTPYFLSPEQVEGELPSKQSDIYALGVSLYYSLCGEYPFYAKTIPAVFKQILSGEYTPIKDRGIYVPTELLSVIDKCLKKNPAERYENAAALAEDLNHFLYTNQIRNDKNEVEKYLQDPENYSKELVTRNIKLISERALSYKNQNLIFEAMREYESILQLDPDNKDIKDKISELKSMRFGPEDTDLNMQTMVMPRKSGATKWWAIGTISLVIVIAIIWLFGIKNSPQNPIKKNQSWQDSLLAMKIEPIKDNKNSLKKDTVKLKEEKVVNKKRVVKKKMEISKKTQILIKPKKRSLENKTGIENQKTDTTLVKAESCYGYLFLFSELWGNIYLNDKKVGRAPTKEKLKVPCGNYTLRLENPGGKKYSAPLIIEDNLTKRLQIKMADFK